jgi:hypothetical protein
MEPTLAGFQSFLVNVAGISTTVLPSDSPVIVMSYNIATVTVARPLECFAFTDAQGNKSSLYALAVYNLATANLFLYAQDQPDAAIVPGSVSDQNPQGLPFFAFARKQWNLLGYLSGSVQSTFDQGTGSTMVVPEAAETFTLDDLQLSKSPYGRAYLGLAQKLGPTLFGLT